MSKKRTCQWMVPAKNYDDCGAPAEFLHVGSQLAYCRDHAFFSAIIAMEIIPIAALPQNSAQSARKTTRRK
jgi:hypothetical protein